MFGCRLHQSTDKRLSNIAGTMLSQRLEFPRVGPYHAVDQGVQGRESGRRGEHAVRHLAKGPHVTSLIADLGPAFGVNELWRHILPSALD